MLPFWEGAPRNYDNTNKYKLVTRRTITVVILHVVVGSCSLGILEKPRTPRIAGIADRASTQTPPKLRVNAPCHHCSNAAVQVGRGSFKNGTAIKNKCCPATRRHYLLQIKYPQYVEWILGSLGTQMPKY